MAHNFFFKFKTLVAMSFCANRLFLLLAFLLLFKDVCAHARWKCPLPRDEKDANGVHINFDNTGNKVGACGPQSGKWVKL